MKKLIIFSILLFSMMFSTPSFAEWKEVGKSATGNTYYADFERIRKQDGYIYYWGLSDNLKPTKQGVFSGKAYYQIDCKMIRHKILSDIYFDGQMGRGTKIAGNNVPDKNWNYQVPGSTGEAILKSVCASAKRIK